MYRIYHWDTFEDAGEDTTEVASKPTLEAAKEWVENTYRVSENGADQVHIVDPEGNVVERYHVG